MTEANLAGKDFLRSCWMGHFVLLLLTLFSTNGCATKSVRIGSYLPTYPVYEASDESDALKTQRGAEVGDLFMSVIHTCRLAEVNPFDYLSALVGNVEQVRARPADWLPWNYRDALPKEGNTS